MKTLKEEREAIVDKLSTICKQADQYQINAGYPVETPAIKIVEALLLSHEEKVRDERDTYWKERVRKEVEGMKKEHIPADNVWEGDEEQEVGEWKFVPKEDGMYCLNCERFTPEEGCICGLISFEALDTLLDNLK